jgi:hypothetical protein
MKLIATSAALALAALGLAGCGDSGCATSEKAPPIKTEYKYEYISYSDLWHEGGQDDLLDGAIRVRTWTMMDGRTLSLRCYVYKPAQREPQFDLRYSIEVPLLKRVAEEVQKAGPVQLALAIDGTTHSMLEASALKHDWGMSFLADISPETLDAIAAAKETIVVMPRQKGEKLDSIIKFGVARLVDLVKPVEETCARLKQEQAPPSSPDAPKVPPPGKTTKITDKA